MPFARPTTTATPDEIFEEWVHVLRHAELLALLYVVRRTLGFKKVEDSISYTQFLDGITTREGKVLDRGCGIKNRTTLAAALRRLEELGLIHSYKTQDARGDRATTRYGLWFAGDDAHATDRAGDHPTGLPTHDAQGGGTQTVLPQYAGRTTGSTAGVPPVVRPAYSQQTVETTHTIQQTDLSKRAPRALPSSPSLASIDSMVLTKNDVSTEHQAAPDASPVSGVVARLSTVFGDDAPQASRTRVLNMQRAANLDDNTFLALLNEAAAIARSQGPMITKRGRSGVIIRMPYLLATLKGLVEAIDNPTVADTLAARDAIPSPSEDADVPDLDDTPVPSAAIVLWRAVLGEVRRDVTPENYATWFVPTRALALDGDVLRVGVPTPFHAQWLEHKLRGCVDRAVRHTGRGEVRIVYEVVTPADQVTVPVPTSATSAVRPSASPRETPTAVPAPQARAASSAAPPPVVACPWCRAAPCRCRLTDHLRRTVAARIPVAQVAAP